MAISLKFYKDSALTQSLDSATLTIDREIGGDPVDVAITLGSTNAQSVFQAADGGPIVVSIIDGVAGDGGFTPSDFLLASSQSGLDTATPGQPLQINGGINGGAYNGASIWIRFFGTSPTPKTSIDLGLVTNPIREYAR